MHVLHSPKRQRTHSHKVKESPLDFRIVSNRWERMTAYRLVYDTYLRRGLISPNHYRLRVTPYHLLPTTHTFIAVQNQQIVCSVSLIGDGQLGLPMESVYSEEVGQARANGLYVGEVSCLASRHEDFRQFLPIFVQLTRLMAQYARGQGMDQFLIAVHPKHSRFYERFMGFEQIGPLRQFPSVQDAPAVACCLDFARIDRERPNCWNDFFGTPLPKAKLQIQPISQDEVDYFRPAAKFNEVHVLITA
jgi:hypothetical protein